MKSEFGKIFQIALERSGYSQKTAADLLHVTPQTINSYLNGRSIPNIETFSAMMKYFGIDMLEVFDLDPIPEQDDLNHEKICEIARKLSTQQITLIKGILLYFHTINTNSI